MVDGRLEVARLEDIANDEVREAYRVEAQTGQDEFVFRSPRNGREINASFTKVPDIFGHPWESVILTPTDDFIGGLKTTNRQIVIVIVGLTALELLLIYLFSHRLARPIEGVSQDLKSAGNRSAAIGGVAVAQFPAVVFGLRAGGRHSWAHQIRGPAEPRHGSPRIDHHVLRS
jgi:hypothetical protein